MKYENIIKKQTTIIVVSVIIMVIIIIGTSYSLFMQVNESTNVQVVESGNLTIEYTGGTTITTATLPQWDLEGKNTAGYSFSVKNNGTLPMTYSISLYNNPTQVAEGATLVPHQYIRLSIDGGEVKTLSTITKTADTASETNENNIKYLLKENLSLNVGNTANHNIKIWIDEDAPTSIINNTVALEINVAGEVPTE